MARTPCSACTLIHGREWRQPSRHCHECKGLGYIETYNRLPGCKQNEKTCPFEDEAMTGGWMCTHCGASGPW